MRNWKLYLTTFASLCFIFKPTETSRACGWDMEGLIDTYSFFDPATTQLADFSPLFLSIDRFYDFSWTDPAFRQRDNLAEWQAYFKGQVPQEAIADVVYRWPIKDLLAVKPWVDSKGKKSPPADSAQANALVQYWKNERWSVPICYLEFAKRCEPFATQNQDLGYWDVFDDEGPDLDEMSALIQEGSARYAETRDDFIKLRYAYQVVRMAHYAGYYEDCLQLYDELVAPLASVESLIQDWALGHKAGALMALGQRVEANYLYSRIFERSPAKRVPAWMSFSVQDDAEWEAILARCQNDHERATLHLMRGIDYYARTVEEMAHILALEPSSPYLELLMAREINKLESDLLGWDFDFAFPIQQRYEGQDLQRALTYRQTLQAFGREVIASGQARRPAFWQLADAWLSFIGSDFDAAERQLTSLIRSEADPVLTRQAQLLQWVVQVSRLDGLPLATETRLYTQWEAFDFGDDPHQLKEKAELYMRGAFARHYTRSGQSGKAYLCTHTYDDLLYRPQPAVVASLLDWTRDMAQRGATPFEAHLQQTRLGLPDARPALIEMQGTFAMARGDWRAAIQAYEQVPEARREAVATFVIGTDPYLAQTYDCINCYDGMSSSGTAHTRLSLARELDALQETVRRDSLPAALFDLGNAIYNTSYFGHAWRATAYFRGSSDWGYTADTPHPTRAGRTLLQDAMYRAEACFTAAMRRATDPEFAAKAAFMAAKCAQNRYYLDGYSDEDIDAVWQVKPTYRQPLDQLIDRYGETAFYQQALRECSYLDMYTWLRNNR